MTTIAAETKQPEVLIVYDGQCPFCSRYVELVRLRQSLGQVRLINAREGGPLVDELQRAPAWTWTKAWRSSSTAASTTATSAFTCWPC